MIKERGAGILLAISSLPSRYGIGDLGNEAKKFADLLADCRQSYWQVLPVNPVSGGSFYSPYSSISGSAGNILLIDPDALVREGYLRESDVSRHQLPEAAKTDYATAEKVKNGIFDIAFNNFLNGEEHAVDNGFLEFCARERYWLDDLALFVTIKEVYEGEPWFLWPGVYKNRQVQAIQLFAEQNIKAIKKVKWLQYIFFRQWHELKLYCNKKGIQLFGDMPFYASYDSADVWANRELFSIDDAGKMTGVAGVPPDYFSADGQLWGMPTFNWQRLEQTGYDWWVSRLRKNMEFFDVLRLDHFRAFDEYWEIPATAESAKEGKWLDGPGMEFFNAMHQALGKLPFVAEDLGDKMASVFDLRDELMLPGMKILLFAFGGEIATSIYAPHNYAPNCICYTGTHDNNTVVGWYQQDIDDSVRARVSLYTGMDVSEKNIHIVLARLAYASVAGTVILPMQDVLGLDGQERMNKPSTTIDNWQWRLLPGQFTDDVVTRLRTWTEMYNRA